MSLQADQGVVSAIPEPAAPRAVVSERDAPITDQLAPVLALAGKRVLFIVPQPFFEDRGSPIAVLQVVRAMSELGMHVDMLAFSSGQPVEVDNLRIFRAGEALRIRNVPIGFSMKKVLLDFALIRALRSRLKTQDYDCVHALEDGIYVALAAGASGQVPLIYDMHSCIPEQLSTHWLLGNPVAQWLLKKMERYALRRATVVSCSVGLKDYIKSCAPTVPVTEWAFSDPDIGTMARRLDEPARSLRAEMGIDPNARVILYAGNFKDYQGVDILVDSIAIVRQAHPDAVLVLLGASNGDNVEELRARGNGGLIVWPRQPHNRVSNYLHMAQILVSPRRCGDNLPLKLFEYLAAGKPIVATDNKHHRMVLREDRAVFADSTSEGLAAAISGLLDNPDKMERLAAAAKEYSDQELGWSNFVGSVADLYTNAIQSPAE